MQRRRLDTRDRVELALMAVCLLVVAVLSLTGRGSARTLLLAVCFAVVAAFLAVRVLAVFRDR
jgi:hypothetical protein